MPDGASTAVVIVGYGSHELLSADHFAALGAAPGVRLVVVDSFSSEGERDLVQRLGAARGWTVLPLPDNPGFGAAVNRGVEEVLAGGNEDVVIVLNPDAVMTADVMRVLSERVRDDPDLLLCPVIEDARGSVWFGGGDVLVDQGRLRTRGVGVATADHPWITGACLAFSPEVWRRLGGFDERYFMYWEDVDLSWRARRMGARVDVDPSIRVTHLVGATQGRGGKSDLYRRYNARNRLLFAATHLTGPTLRTWVRRTPAYAWTILVRGGRRQLVRRPFGTAWPVLRGSLEGCGLVFRAWVRRRRANP